MGVGCPVGCMPFICGSMVELGVAR
jgi:hypothetical protein